MAEPTPAAAPEPGAPAAGKPSRKRLFVVVGLAFLLAGGGVAYFLLQRPAKSSPAAAAVHVDPIFVALDPPFVVNFESEGLVRFLQVTVQAETGDAAAAERLKKHDPVIRNGLLMLLSGQTYQALATRDGKEKLRRDALAEVRRVVDAAGGKPSDVRNLYFTSFVMQ